MEVMDVMDGGKREVFCFFLNMVYDIGEYS